MARCPFARWDPIEGTTNGGTYTSGPFKIVHHTTEGTSFAGARATFRDQNVAPHFTVDASTIYQHIDTGVAARALRNNAGGVQTNRESAVQIEMVGFAGQPKNRRTLANAARLCRWIEAEHGVPQVWPNGHPRPPRNGRDPGGHNRTSANWASQGGHYGHSQVPENSHWDPAYTEQEVAFVMGTSTEDAERLLAEELQPGEDAPVESESATLRLGQKVPNTSEAAAVGPFVRREPRSAMVRNDNPNIVFQNDEGNQDDRYMTPRLWEKVDRLAQLVPQEWPGTRLRVTDAWDEGQGHAATSRHYEGRAADMNTYPIDRGKLGRLAGLAVQAGFDWVWYEDVRHIHGSVLRQGTHDAAEETAHEAPQPMAAEEFHREYVSELREYLLDLEAEERHLQVLGRALTPEEEERTRQIAAHVPMLEAAIVLLSTVFGGE